MSKLTERLTVVANLSVVVGIVLVAAELRQNTRAVQAQIRDSITDKQMVFAGWIGTNPQAADVYQRGREGGYGQLSSAERTQFTFLAAGMMREWENSSYQYERGLFTEEEFSARMARWASNLASPGYRDYWAGNQEAYAATFRAQVDSIIAATR